MIVLKRNCVSCAGSVTAVGDIPSLRSVSLCRNGKGPVGTVDVKLVQHHPQRGNCTASARRTVSIRELAVTHVGPMYDGFHTPLH